MLQNKLIQIHTPTQRGARNISPAQMFCVILWYFCSNVATEIASRVFVGETRASCLQTTSNPHFIFSRFHLEWKTYAAENMQCRNANAAYNLLLLWASVIIGDKCCWWLASPKYKTKLLFHNLITFFHTLSITKKNWNWK